MNAPVQPEAEEREAYPWEKRDAREARIRSRRLGPAVPEFTDAAVPIDERMPPNTFNSRENPNHPCYDLLNDFGGMIETHAVIDLAAKSAGAGSPLHTTPTVLAPDDGNFHEWAMLEDGTLADIPELDGYGPELWQAEEHTRPDEAAAEGLRLRDGEFVFFCKNRAGEVAPADAHAKAIEARTKMDAQSMDMALGLATQGIDAFQPKSAPRISIVDPFSEQRLDVAPLRRVNFFPSVAKQRRAGMLVHLNAWLDANPLTRMFTFTSGGRVRLDIPGEIKGRFKFLHRRLSNIHAHPYLRRIGCRFSFRASEVGTLYRACPFPREKGTEEGVIFAHIHAHVFVNFDHQLSPKGLRKFLRRIKSIWRYHWDFGRTVANAAEACKYPVKPGDFEILNDKEKAAFYRETRKLHIVQPLGGLRESIAERHEIALKGRKWRGIDKETKKSELKIKFRPDWNARPRKPAAQRAAEAYQRDRLRVLGLTAYSSAAELLGYANGLLSFEKRVRKDESKKLHKAVETAAGILARARRDFNSTRPATKAATLALARAEAAHGAAKALYAAGPTFRLSAADRAALLAQVAALRAAATTFLTFPIRPKAERRWLGVKKLKEVEKTARPQTVICNRVPARLGPAPFFDRVYRPALMVWNFNGDYAALRELPFVKEYGAAVAAQIADAEAKIAAESAGNSAVPNHSVHTSHITATRARRASDPTDPGLLASAEVWQAPPDPKISPSTSALATARL